MSNFHNIKDFVFLIILILGMLASVQSQEKEIERIKQTVEYLSSAELAGRDTPGYYGDLTALWLAQSFLEIGLSPFFGDTSYLQEIPLITANLDTDKTKLKFIVNGKETTLDWGSDFYYFPKNISDEEISLPLQFAGHGIVAKEFDVNDFKESVKGSAAIVLNGSGDLTPEQAGRHSMPPFKAAAARRAGAKMLIIIPNEGDEFPFKSLEGKIKDSSKKLTDSKSSTIGFPVIYLNFQKLPGNILENENHIISVISDTKVILRPAFKNMQEENAQNVAGIIKGSDDNYIIVGAHYDHLGIKDEVNNEILEYYPGADDNASGIAGLMEIARYWANRPNPQKSLIFVGFTSEEDGLLGSRDFLERRNVEPEKIHCMINLDMIGRDGFSSMMASRIPGSKSDSSYCAVYYSAAAPKFVDFVKGTNNKFNLNIDPIPVSRFHVNDAESFHTRQIPSVHVFSGFHSDYSSTSDISEKILFWKIFSISQFVAEMTMNISEYPSEIDFDPSIKPPVSGMKY